jgi:glycerate 2-kinase
VRYLIAPDSYKGTLTAPEAARIMAEAIRALDPAAEIDCCPLSDGGEGLLNVIHAHTGGSFISCRTIDAGGSAMTAEWLKLPDSATAIIESASCLGLALLDQGRRIARRNSSEGLGVLLADAARSGCRRILVGLGGSATNDCGYGLARSLGYNMSNAVEEDPVDLIVSMHTITGIGSPSTPVLPQGLEVVVLADVTNPLLGSDGATRTYGRQKGVSEHEMSLFEDAIRHFSELVRRDVTDTDPMHAGMGAAGGLGFALAAFCGAEIVSGTDFVLKITDFPTRCARADLIFTGEGRLDAQTRFGKIISGVASAGARAGIPVIAVVGTVEGDPETIRSSLGLTRIQPLSIRPTEADLRPDRVVESLGEAVKTVLNSMHSF